MTALSLVRGMCCSDFRESEECASLTQNYFSVSGPENYSVLSWGEILLCRPLGSAGNLEFLLALSCGGSTNQVPGILERRVPPPIQSMLLLETVQTRRLGLCYCLLSEGQVAGCDRKGSLGCDKLCCLGLFFFPFPKVWLFGAVSASQEK